MTQKPVVDIEAVDANLFGLVLPMGLRVERVTLKGSHLRLQRTPFSVNTPQPGTIEVLVTTQDIGAFLNKLGPAGLKNIQVKAKDGLLHLDATKTVLLDLSVSAQCGFRIEGGRKLMIELKSIDVMGVGTKQLVQSQLDKINPVLDTADLPIDATVDTVTVSAEGVLLQGQIRSG